MSSGANLKAACLKHLRIAHYKATNSARPQYALVRRSSEVLFAIGCCSRVARAQAISSLERFPAPVTSVSDLTILRGFTVPMLNALVSGVVVY
jgi:hypothetical protein